MDSGRHVEIDVGEADSLGWTPDGWLIKVGADSVDVGDPDTGACKGTPVAVEGKVESIRVGGSLYES